MSTTQYIINSWFSVNKDVDGDILISNSDKDGQGVIIAIKAHEIRYLRELIKDLDKLGL